MTRSKRGLLERLFVFSLVVTTVGCGGGGAKNDGGSGGHGAGGMAGGGATTTDSGADAPPLSGDCLRLYDCCVGPAAQTAQFCAGLVAQGICDVWLQSYAMAGIQCAAVTTGAGGAGGSADAGAAAGTSGHGGLDAATTGLPACAIVTQPKDPVDGGISATSGTCNTLPLSGKAVTPGPLTTVDAGVRVDGGGIETPGGGQLLDGDYEFVRWLESTSSGPSRRELRVFGGGTYIEWAATVAATGSGSADLVVRYDTTASAAGHTLTFPSYTCGNDVFNGSYPYGASGDELTFFNTIDTPKPGTLISVDSYRRTCTRP